eukprot:808338-Pleurochrysis_carterae.AAC.1
MFSLAWDGLLKRRITCQAASRVVCAHAHAHAHTHACPCPVLVPVTVPLFVRVCACVCVCACLCASVRARRRACVGARSARRPSQKRYGYRATP